MACPILISDKAFFKEKEVFEPLLTALKDNDSLVRESVLHFFSRLATYRSNSWYLKLEIAQNRFVPAIRKCLLDAKASVRREAVRCLSLYLKQKAVPDVLSLIDDPDFEVRLSAISALRNIGGGSDVVFPLMNIVAVDTVWPDLLLQREALLVLNNLLFNQLKIGKNANPSRRSIDIFFTPDQRIKVVSILLKKIDLPFLKKEAVTLLGYLGDSTVLNRLEYLISDYDPMVRKAALISIAMIWKFSKEKEKLEPNIVNIFMKALQDKNSAVKMTAIKSLAETRDPKAIPNFLEIFKTGESVYRECIIEAFQYFEDERIKELLIEALEKDESKKAGINVFKALSPYIDVRLLKLLPKYFDFKGLFEDALLKNMFDKVLKETASGYILEYRQNGKRKITDIALNDKLFIPSESYNHRLKFVHPLAAKSLLDELPTANAYKKGLIFDFLWLIEDERIKNIAIESLNNKYQSVKDAALKVLLYYLDDMEANHYLAIFSFPKDSFGDDNNILKLIHTFKLEKDNLKIIEGALKIPDDKKRLNALQLLNWNCTNPYMEKVLSKLFDLICKCFEDPNEKIAAAAISLAGKSKNKIYLDPLIKMLVDPSFKKKNQALTVLSSKDFCDIASIRPAMGLIHDKKIRGPLIQFFSNLVKNLGADLHKSRIIQEEIIPAFLDALNQDDTSIFALHVLNNFHNDQILEAVLARYDKIHKNIIIQPKNTNLPPFIIENILYVLGKYDDPRVRNIFLNILAGEGRCNLKLKVMKILKKNQYNWNKLLSLFVDPLIEISKTNECSHASLIATFLLAASKVPKANHFLEELFLKLSKLSKYNDKGHNERCLLILWAIKGIPFPFPCKNYSRYIEFIENYNSREYKKIPIAASEYFNDIKIVETLIKMFRNSQDIELKHNIVYTIGKIGGNEAVDFLEQLLESKSLDDLKIYSSLTYGYDRVIFALRDTHTERAYNKIINELERSDALSIRPILKCLRCCAGKNVLYQLLSVADKRPELFIAIRDTVSICCENDEAWEELLLTYIRPGIDDPLRLLAMKILRYVDVGKAKREIARYLNDPNPSIKNFAEEITHTQNRVSSSKNNTYAPQVGRAMSSIKIKHKNDSFGFDIQEYMGNSKWLTMGPGVKKRKGAQYSKEERISSAIMFDSGEEFSGKGNIARANNKSTSSYKNNNDVFSHTYLLSQINSDSIKDQMHAIASYGYLSAKEELKRIISFLNSPDQKLKQRAVISLGLIGDNAAIPPLLKLLGASEPKIKKYIIWALGKMDQPCVVKVLSSLLIKSKNRTIQVASALALMNSSSGREKVLEHLKVTNDDVLKIYMFDCFASFENMDLNEIYLNSLNDSNQYVRQAAARALGTQKDGRAVPELIKLLNDSDYYVRKAVIIALGKERDIRAVKPLCNMIIDNDYKIALLAKKVLGEYSDESAIKIIGNTILGELYSKDSIGIKKAEILSKIVGDKVVVDHINASIDNKVQLVQTYIDLLELEYKSRNLHLIGANALMTYEDRAFVIDKLIMNFKNQISGNMNNMLWRSPILSLLVKLEARIANPFFLEILRSPKNYSYWIRKYAILFFIKVENKEAFLLIKNRLRDPDENDYTKMEAINYFSKDANLENTNIILNVILNDKETEKVRNHAIIALGKTGNTIAIKHLLKIIENKDIKDKLRISAVIALGSIGDKKAITILEKIIQNKDGNLREAAKAALNRINRNY